MREGAESGAWWRTRWFYLASQAKLGLLFVLIFGACVFSYLPLLMLLLAASSLLLVPFAFFPRLNPDLDSRTLALLDREKIVRKDLAGRKSLLASVSEDLSPVVPDFLGTTWRILAFEHRRDHTFVELQPEQHAQGRRMKLALSFVDGQPCVVGLFRYDEGLRTWSHVFGTNPSARGERMKFSSGFLPREIPALIAVFWVLPVILLALSAPCRAIMLLGHAVWTGLPAGMDTLYPVSSLFGIKLLPGHLDILGGACGAALGILGMCSVGLWQLRLARQVKNIPTVTARSAVPGLAEFRGIARGRKTILHFSTGDTEASATQMLAPFDLDDGTGTIRVDPQGAAVRSFWSLQFLQRLGGSVVLTKRVTQRTYGRREVRELKEGDPVYVLGNVELDAGAASDAVGPDRLVVRRGRRQMPLPFLYRLLKVDHPPETFTYLDVFFVSDTAEQRAHDWIMADFRRTVAVASVWITSSSWLLWQGGRAIGVW